LQKVVIARFPFEERNIFIRVSGNSQEANPMKYLIIIPAILSLVACTTPEPQLAGDPGNPDHFVYVGSPGSAYDPATNPPLTVGTVTYNPDAPVPPIYSDAPPPDMTTPPAPAPTPSR
jgi:hypothetical protein